MWYVHHIHPALSRFMLIMLRYWYLGVVIEEDRKWTKHIDSVCNKLVKYTSIFYKLRD